MSPQAIVQRAIEQGLDMIAITDHNTAGNVQAVIDAARNTALTVLPGMEIATREEVHVVALFPSVEMALAVQEVIQPELADSDDENYIMDQILVNGDEEVEGFCSKLLLSATSFSIRKLVKLIHEHNGLAIAAHIDRQAFGIIGQLGFIPPKVEFDALEISWRSPAGDYATLFPDYSHYTFVTSSDAHYLADIGKCRTVFLIDRPEIDQMAEALRASDGCHVEYLP